MTRSPTNIIVRIPNWIGDAIMATPVLEDLRKKYPGAQLTAMCQNNVAAVVENNPHINDIFPFKRHNGWIHRAYHEDLYTLLRHGAFDTGVLLTNSFSSAWWFWRGGVKNRIGFKGNVRSLLLNHAVDKPQELEKQHLVVTYKELLAPLAILVSDTQPSLYLTEGEITAAKELLKQCGITPEDKIIGINPGAAYGSAKCWPAERFEAVTRKLLSEEKNMRIVYFGDGAGAKVVDGICDGFPEGVVNLAGKTTLRQLMALISCCDIIVTNDSGPMHIAAALKRPLVALFGSTNPTKTGPYGSGDKIMLYKQVACSPCYKRVCPIDFRCMKKITADDVYNAIMILNKKL